MDKVGLTSHLKDLRKTCIYILLTLVIGFIICYIIGDSISIILLAPLKIALDSNDRIIFTGILDKVISYFQISFWASIIISSPIWSYFIWNFIRPGLYQKELKVIRPFFIMAFVFFMLGIVFGYYIVFPSSIKMFLNFGVTDVQAMPNLKEYLLLSIKVLVFLGFLFEFPLIIIILGLLGIVSYDLLKKGRPYVYLALAILSGFFTPPDVLTMLLLWIPLIILFELGTVSLWLKNRIIK